MADGRLPARWLDFKVARWNECSEPAAVLGYLRMYTSGDLTERVRGLPVPMLVICGEHDQPWMREPGLREAFSCYPHVTFAECRNAGHYPMYETPVALAALIDRFLAL